MEYLLLSTGAFLVAVLAGQWKSPRAGRTGLGPLIDVAAGSFHYTDVKHHA
jgi:hypothetical protein